MTAEFPVDEVFDTATARSAEPWAGNEDPMTVAPTFATLALKLPELSGTDCCPLKLETTVDVGSMPDGKLAVPLRLIGASAWKPNLNGAVSAFPPRSWRLCSMSTV
jgi:hypothetical protein